MFIHNHKTVRRALYLSVLAIAFLTSCRDTTCRELARIEQLMETSPAEADTLLASIGYGKTVHHIGSFQNQLTL